MSALQEHSKRHSTLLAPYLQQEQGKSTELDRARYRELLNAVKLPIPGKGAWRQTNLVSLMRATLVNVGSQSGEVHATGVDTRKLTVKDESDFFKYFDIPTLKDLHVLWLLNGFLSVPTRHYRSQEGMGEAARIDIGQDIAGISRFKAEVSSKTTLGLRSKISTGNRVILCDVQTDAQLDVDLLFPKSSESMYHHLLLRVGDGARVNLTLTGQGGELFRNEIVVLLNGSNAEVNLTGGWRLSNRAHFDSVIQVHHLVKDSTSNQRFHGVVEDRSRSSFAGLIRIDHGASGSEAHLQNRNIALSTTARALAQPELEIYTDDVICSHGATTGQLDDDVLNYLRSRGIDREEAQQMLVKGFLRDVASSEEAEALLAI